MAKVVKTLSKSRGQRTGQNRNGHNPKAPSNGQGAGRNNGKGQAGQSSRGARPAAAPARELRIAPEEIVFLPLGGTGEIGMNLNLYGHAGQWLMVDLGVSFADENHPGIDLLMADPGFIEARRNSLVGLLVTHGHEDHIGAIPHIWPRLRCPIYATPFTAALVRNKLADAGLLNEVRITEIPLSGHAEIGPFSIELIRTTHSIPEPNAVVIRTSAGTVLHTGDWKLDPEPLLGEPTDEEAFARLGGENVLALIGDSTNALRPGVAGSEAQVEHALTELIGHYNERVAIACFASNVARLTSISRAGAAHDRQVALIGRSLWRMEKAARGTGYLKDVPPFLTEEEAAFLPRSKTLLICTGSQGEPRSALARIAMDDHPHITLNQGDTVIFSSRIIPGNEKAIGEVQNRLARAGVEIVTEHDHFVHVSGHPAREELSHMYRWVQPRAAIPTHGESRHLLAHAEVARAEGVGEVLVVGNGDVVVLGPGPARVADHVETGRLALDGKQLVPLSNPVLRDRKSMIFNGAAVATLVLDDYGRLLADPQVTVHGLIDEEDDDALGDLEDAIAQAVEDMSVTQRKDDDAVREMARNTLRRLVKTSHGKRPLTEVHVIRV